MASILEETRIAMLCVAHLLTDDNDGESPVVQERTVWSCSPSNEGNYSDAMTGVARLVENIFNLTQLQASSAATAAGGKVIAMRVHSPTHRCFGT